MPLIEVSDEVYQHLETHAVTNVDGILRTALNEKVKQSGRLSTEILEHVSDAFFMLDTDWTFRYLNHEAERVLER
ncbi:MAG: hypothetical protein AAF125_26535, partial [Chloroflexota bacterium]